MSVNLETTLQAGPPEEFFQRVMALGNEAPPQFVAAEGAINKAIQSGDPNLQHWASSMQEALRNTAAAEALELSMQQSAASDSMGLGKLGDILNAFKTALADGFQMEDLGTIFNAFSGADPKAQELASFRRAAQNAAQDGSSWLEVARQNGTDVNAVIGANAQAQVQGAMERIDRTVTLPQPGGPGGPGA